MGCSTDVLWLEALTVAPRGDTFVSSQRPTPHRESRSRRRLPVDNTGEVSGALLHLLLLVLRWEVSVEDGKGDSNGDGGAR